MSERESTLSGYAALVRRRVAILTALSIAIVITWMFDVATGPSVLSLGDVAAALFSSGDTSAANQVIIWEIRLPAATMALLVGVALALSGAEMQTVLHNPLASPFTLGLSSAAIFGAALALALNISVPWIPSHWIVSFNAFVFAFASILILQAASRARGIGSQGLVLFGMALFFTFNALTTLLQFIASEQALQQLVFWTMGDLSRSSWDKVQVLAVVVAVLTPLSFMAAPQLTAFRLGEARAQSFGVDVARVRWMSLLRVSLLSGCAVAFVGTIAFVGLVSPHIARLLIGEDHRFFLPASALSGGLLMSLASVVSKSLLVGSLVPVGLITSLIGVPFFIVLILSRREAA